MHVQREPARTPASPSTQTSTPASRSPKSELRGLGFADQEARLRPGGDEPDPTKSPAPASPAASAAPAASTPAASTAPAATSAPAASTPPAATSAPAASTAPAGSSTPAESTTPAASPPAASTPPGAASTPADATPAPAASVDPAASAQSAAQAGAAPAVDAAAPLTGGRLIPYATAPIATAGERILFNCSIPGAAADYAIGLAATGGATFDVAATGAAQKTIQGLATGNTSLFMPSPWDSSVAIRAAFVVIHKASGKVAASKLWTFTPKPYFATEITQDESDGERPLPSTYGYKIGPDRDGDGRDDYIGHTILERFENRTTDLAPEDLKDDYRTANNLTSSQVIHDHFFGPYQANNGTFTVSAGDKIFDRHSGGIDNPRKVVDALKAPKDVHLDLPQVYETKPGVALGRFTVQRIVKADGSTKLRKWKVS